jgi:hypothetical protein
MTILSRAMTILHRFVTGSDQIVTIRRGAVIT